MEFSLIADGNNFVQIDPAEGQRGLGKYNINVRTTTSNNTLLRILLSDYLFINVGFYLGDTIPIQFRINNKYYYLNENGTDSADNTAYSTSDSPGSKTVAFKVLISSKATFNYSTDVNNTQIVFYNFNPVIQGVIPASPPDNFTFLLNTSNPDGRLVYTVTECTEKNSCTFCGTNSCPVGFNCSPNGCVSPVKASFTFGIRYLVGLNQPKILTISIPEPSTVAFGYFNTGDMFAKGSDPGVYPVESWLYVDLPSNKTVMVTGDSYPLYIVNDNEKVYLSSPKKVTETTIHYAPVPSPTGKDILSFSPKKIGNWRSYTFTTSDFSNLVLPDQNTSIALWQNSSNTNKQAVFLGESLIFIPDLTIVDIERRWIILWIVVIIIVLIVLFIIFFVIYRNRKKKAKSNMK